MLPERGILVHPEDLTLQWVEDMKEAQLNVLGLHPVGGKEAHESLERAIRWFNCPESRQMLDAAKAHHIKVEFEAHVMSWLLPRELFAKHPEWFRMNEKGERMADFNLCPSNPEALSFVAERTARLASLLDTGSSDYYYWLDDAVGGRCHCPQCRGLSPSDQQLITINAMLSGLKRYRADARLCYLAYVDAMELPETIKPAEGIFLEYAPIRREHHRPINDPACEQNVRESAGLKELITFFGSKNARVLEYWMDNSLFSHWTKPPKPFTLDEAVMRQDVVFYRSLGFESITSFGCYLGPDYQALYGRPDLKTYGDILRGK